MLHAAGLRKRFGSTLALDGFDLDVRAGEIVGLLGPNGAGKSTFDRVVAGIVRPDAGEVSLDGVDALRDPYRARARLGLAGQEPALYPVATVRENLRLFGRLCGVRGRALGRAVAAVAEELRLGDVLDRRVNRLSGGQQRRAHAAAAMLHRPAVLLLDEPTAGADPVTRDALLGAVRARATEGAAVLYTTHYLPELQVLRATLAVAVAGRVVARGVAADVMDSTGAHDLESVFRHWAGQEAPAGCDA